MSAASAAGTIHAVRSPMAFFQASPSDSASLATHMRAVSENAYAEIAPSPTISALAGLGLGLGLGLGSRLGLGLGLG